MKQHSHTLISANLLIYCIGIIVAVYLPDCLLINSKIALLILISLSLWVGFKYNQRWLWFASFALGLLLGQQHIQSLLKNNQFPHQLEKAKLTLKGQINSIPKEYSNGTSFTFKINQWVHSNDDHDSLSNKKIQLYMPKSIQQNISIQPGQTWQLTVVLKQPHGYHSFSTFDQEAWFLRQNIMAKGFVKSAHLLKKPQQNNIRASLVQWLMHSALDQDNAAIAAAMLVGYSKNISEQTWLHFNQAGMTHLLVISGLHITIIAGLSFILFKWFSLFWYRRKANLRPIASLFALLMALGYAWLAGFAPATQRAIAMTGIAILMPLFGLRISYFTSLLIAFALLITLDPIMITNIGFWYSFACVLALLLIGSNRFNHSTPLMTLIKAQVAIFLLLTPLTAFNLQSASWMASLCNIIAIPFTSLLLLPLLMLSSLIAIALPITDHWIMIPSNYLLTWLRDIANIPNWLDLNNYSWSYPNYYALAIAMIASIIIILPFSNYMRILAGVLWLTWLVPPKHPPAWGEANINVLDVGQGLSIAIQTKQHLLLYDTGGFLSTRFNAARNVIIPFLKNKHIDHINKVIISHGDLDHVGGLKPLLGYYHITSIISGTPLKDIANVTPCHFAKAWNWDGVHFQPFYAKQTDQSRNEHSCLLKVTAHNQSLLLVGDIDSKVEYQLTKSSMNLQADYLVAAHHGSKYASSDVFLTAVKPQQVFFSTGYLNAYHHPAPSTIKRIRKHHAQMWNTAYCGTLSFTLGAQQKNNSTQAYLLTHQRQWWSNLSKQCMI